MDIKKAPIPLKILMVIAALALAAAALWGFGFLLTQYQEAWGFILGVWGGFGKTLPAEYRIWSYAGGLALMLLSGFFFPPVMDRLNGLDKSGLITTIKVVFVISSFVIMCGAGFLALGSIADEFGWWSMTQTVGVIGCFWLAVKLWCRK
jgi:hypothetical protein